jgi:hypothetical protein
MMFLGRFLLILLILLFGALLALAFTPAAWVAPRVQHLSQSAVQLHNAEGTLARGAGLLVVPEIGLRAPIRWRLPDGLGASVEIGGGQARVSRNAAEVSAPIALALSHAAVRGTVTIENGARLIRTPSGISASGALNAAHVNLNVPVPATLTNAKALLQPDGAWQLTAEGDVRVAGSGTLQSLAPPKGSAQIDLTPSSANAALETLIRRNVPADSAGRLRLNRNF